MQTNADHIIFIGLKGIKTNLPDKFIFFVIYYQKKTLMVLQFIVKQANY